jgi:histone H1/5
VAQKAVAKKKSVGKKPAVVAAPVVKTVLNPAAAWPFPTGSRP